MDIGTFNIAICDDDRELHNEIIGLCNSFFIDKNVSYKVYSYYSGEEILKETDRHIDLVFLDIEMGEIDGLSVMEEIEKMPNVLNIVFVSSHHEFAGDAYGYKTLGFIQKPIKEIDFNARLQKVYKRVISDSLVVFSDNCGDYHLRKSDIIYLKADSNYCDIYTIQKKIVTSYTLKKCENILGGMPFLRVHRSYLINVNKISNLSGAYINLITKESIPIGKSYKDTALRSYRQYLYEGMRI
ncbi:LytR/AlgR family response regulator transcription factor [Butyrivibrio sp. LB2008]|uniref:LytR/AlgR family response regulator transcription factor n=1 Tax=Butyrivibrio sp. LB2008 TaxID=1408305 RepID=UPI00047AC54F|nr:LytTR family DNA-binding domain-containing protein [Butyrivibrio sp. LB2008]